MLCISSSLCDITTVYIDSSNKHPFTVKMFITLITHLWLMCRQKHAWYDRRGLQKIRDNVQHSCMGKLKKGCAWNQGKAQRLSIVQGLFLIILWVLQRDFLCRSILTMLFSFLIFSVKYRSILFLNWIVKIFIVLKINICFCIYTHTYAHIHYIYTYACTCAHKAGLFSVYIRDFEYNN